MTKLRAAVISLAALVGCTPSATERLGLPPLTTVAQVDLGRYTGTWYEIGSFPQSFQRGCTGRLPTSEYWERTASTSKALSTAGVSWVARWGSAIMGK